MMSTLTNDELIHKIRSGDAAAIEELWQRVRRLVISICRRYGGRDPAVSMDDLEDEGFLALMDAVRDFDPERGTTFTGYLSRRVQWHLQRYLDGGAYRLSEYRKFCSEYAMIYGREPSAEVTAALMGITEEQALRLRDCEIRSHTDSVDAEVDEDTDLEDLLPSSASVEDDAIAEVDAEILRSALWSEVDSLPDACPIIIRMYYQDNRTIAAISEETGLPADKVKRCREKSLRSLRSSRRLRPFLEDLSDEIYSHSLRGGGLTRFKESGTSSVERIALKLSEKECKGHHARTSGDDPEQAG